MRIGIDARFLTHPQRGGFKTYTTHLIAALARIDAANAYVLYTDRPLDAATPLPPNFRVTVVPGAAPMVGLAWREQVDLPRAVAHDHLDLLHSPCLTAPLRRACPSVVTIHDMIWRFPEEFSTGARLPLRRRLMAAYYRHLPERAARNAAVVITVSEAARAAIAEHLTIPAERIVVTPEGPAPHFRVLTDHLAVTAQRVQQGLPENYVLAIGSADPRKNMARLVEAYAALPAHLRAVHHLAIVWTHGYLAQEIAAQVAALGVSEQVHFLYTVDDAALAQLYNGAALFVFPSLYEGFGLPPLEAMACGAPVAAADNSSIPEIVGDAALLFTAKAVAQITQVMHAALADAPLRADLRRRGLERVRRFSWDACAAQTLHAYAQAIATATVVV
jgi:glycosyltransferase involved in cell wall biosynthesis